MDNYLLDHEILGEFVDELMKTKPVPAQNAEELNALREQNIKKLDDEITGAIFGSLSSEQLQELDGILDQDNGTPDVYTSFFTNAGINLEDIITKTMQKFKSGFLGSEA